MLNYRNGREYVKCLYDDCTNLTSSKHGLCIPHYKQRWYLNSVGREELTVRTSKGRWIHKTTGYVLIEHNHRLEYEHRVLAEKALGKSLPNNVVIHHI